MDLNTEPLYFKPLFWKKEYYSLEEFCLLLGVQKPLFQKKFHQAIFDEFYKASYTGFEDVYQFERLRGSPNANGFLTPTVLTKHKHSCFLPYYEKGDINFLVSKEGALAFIDAYQEELVHLGVSRTHLKSILHNIPFQTKEPKNVLTLWDFTKKFTKNSKNVLKLADYISNTLFDAYFQKQMPDGTITYEPMFLYWRGKRRSTNFFFNLEALDYFKKHYADVLAKKEAEIEAQNEFVSIRQFLWQISGRHSLDKKVSDFIKNNLLHITYTEVDEFDNTTIKPVFELDHNNLSMRKKAIYPFAKAYQKELESLGVINVKHVLNNSIRLKDLPKEAVTVSKLLQQNQLFKFIPQILPFVEKAYQKQKPSSKEPLIKTYHFKNKVEYFVLKKDASRFFKTIYKDLLSLGVNKDRLDNLTGKNPLPQRNKSMVLMKDMFYALGIQPKYFKRLREEIETHFIQETYLHEDETGQKTPQPIFIKANSQHSVTYVIQNKQAMQAFLKSHGDFFLKNKVHPLRLNDASGVQPILPATNDQLTIEALAQFLMLSQRFRDYAHKNLLDATYEVVDETGQKVQKKMFSPVRSKTGHIVYAIDKKAIPQLEERIKTYRINADRQRRR